MYELSGEDDEEFVPKLHWPFETCSGVESVMAASVVVPWAAVVGSGAGIGGGGGIDLLDECCSSVAWQ